MMAQAPNRSLRLEARITPDGLSAVRRAAELQGRSASDFVVAAAQDAAHRIIADTHIIRLAADDQIRFVELLLNPPPLIAALDRAREAHGRLIQE